MRSSKNRSRSKSNNRQRSIGNIINRVFDSSGPESKVRGTPQQIIEKYLQLARDAQLSNDRVAEQNFLQHAEHYTRMLGEAQAELAREQASRPPQGGNDRPQYSGNRDRDDQQPSGNYGDQPGLYEPEEAAIVETPEMRSRSENDQRREPRQNNNNQNNNRNDGQRNDGQRYEGQRDRNQPRNDNYRQPRNDQNRNDQNRNDQNRNDQNRNDNNRGDQDRSDQNRSDAPRQEQPRQEQPRQEQPRAEQTIVQTHEDRPRREPRPPRPPRDEVEASGADIPLPAFVAEPLRVVDAAPVTEAAEKPKPRRRTAKPVVEAAPNDSDSAPSE